MRIKFGRAFAGCCGVVCTVLLAGSAQPQPLHILKVFCSPLEPGCTEGASPSGGLISDAAGNAYGATYYGGNPGCGENLGCGTIFKMSQRGVLTVLYSFEGGTNGGNPVGRLTLDKNGNLYGSAGGGANNEGIVFKLSPDGTETVLHAFGSADGSLPAGSLLLDKKQNLYGITRGSPGGVFKLTPDGKETVLYTFCRQAHCTDGQNPNEGLAADDEGDLYGTTQYGGNGGIIAAGTVFEVTSKGKETVLWNFCSQQSCEDGEFPNAGLVRDRAGNLYGTTDYGGLVGTVFEFTPDGTETVLHSFNADADGYNPLTPVMLDNHGNLYGTTSAGGAYSAGTAFMIAPGGGFTKLADFPITMEGPSGLLLGKHGALFGTSPAYLFIGSNTSGGTVFAITK